MDGQEEENALQVVLEDGRVQEVATPGVVLLSRQRLDLTDKKTGLGRGGGLVVSVLAFYSDDPSLNPAGY